MPEDYSKFPTFNKAVQSIDRLSKVDWPIYEEGANIDEFVKSIDKIIYSEFDIFLNIIQPVKISDFKLQFFRVRELSSFTNPNVFAEHSYPPINLTGMGRCNFPKHPVFYASNDPLVALLEVVRDEDYSNKKYCISSWELINSDEDLMFQTFLQTKLHEENPFNVLKEGTNENFDNSFEQKLSPEQKAGTQEYLKFLQSSFINDSGYSLSASIAYKALFAPHNMATDILLYPSVQARFKGVNMAINTNFVDQKMVVKRFYIVEVQNYNPADDSFQLKFTRYGDVSKNVLMWKDLHPNDSLYEEYMRKDFKLHLNDFKSTFQKRK